VRLNWDDCSEWKKNETVRKEKGEGVKDEI
jgi:hypothetical protein